MRIKIPAGEGIPPIAVFDMRQDHFSQRIIQAGDVFGFLIPVKAAFIHGGLHVLIIDHILQLFDFLVSGGVCDGVVIVDHLLIGFRFAGEQRDGVFVFFGIVAANQKLVVAFIDSGGNQGTEHADDRKQNGQSRHNNEPADFFLLFPAPAAADQLRMLEIVQQLGAALIAVLGGGPHAFVDDRLNPFGQVGVPLPDRSVGLAVAGIHAREQVVHRHAQREDIRPRVGLAAVLLRRGVALGAEHGGIRKVLLLVLSGDPEVDDLDVACGQGSIAMEIIKELPTVDYILVPIGGGGLATGVSTFAKLLNPHIKVIGVEPAGAACMKESLKNGKVTTLPAVDTIADGTAVKTPGSKIFPYIQKNIDEIITVDDSELIVAFLDMLENHKMLVENSGLLTAAAVKNLPFKDKKVVSILSGGNMDVITFASVVQHGLIARSRIFTVSVLLPDKPGELKNVSSIIADLQGNIIKLEHNQFVNLNRNAAVELIITMEAFGPEHKENIMHVLAEKGYNPVEKNPKSIY